MKTEEFIAEVKEFGFKNDAATLERLSWDPQFADSDELLVYEFEDGACIYIYKEEYSEADDLYDIYYTTPEQEGIIDTFNPDREQFSREEVLEFLNNA